MDVCEDDGVAGDMEGAKEGCAGGCSGHLDGLIEYEGELTMSISVFFRSQLRILWVEVVRSKKPL